MKSPPFAFLLSSFFFFFLDTSQHLSVTAFYQVTEENVTWYILYSVLEPKRLRKSS